MAEPFDLADITADQLSSTDKEIEQLNLDLQTTISPAPAFGIPRLTKRLVASLLDNAQRHNLASGYINVVTRTDSRHAILSVTNSGPIIAPNDLDRLFQPFQRLDNGRTYHTHA